MNPKCFYSSSSWHVNNSPVGVGRQTKSIRILLWRTNTCYGKIDNQTLHRRIED